MYLVDNVRDLLNSRTWMGGIEKSVNPFSQNTESSEYLIFKTIFNYIISIENSDVIVDVGCGKGRVIAWLSNNYRSNQIIGYEINKKIALKVTNKFIRNKKVKIFDKNIFDDFPVYGTIFYLFNPFKIEYVHEFAKYFIDNNLVNATIIYYNAVYLGVFQNYPEFQINEYNIKEGYPWVAIIRRK